MNIELVKSKKLTYIILLFICFIWNVYYDYKEK